LSVAFACVAGCVLSTFYERQRRLHAVLMEPPVGLHIIDPRGTPRALRVEPGRRPISDLPAVFWFQLLAGASGF
jgi:hypothetical protein